MAAVAGGHRAKGKRWRPRDDTVAISHDVRVFCLAAHPQDRGAAAITFSAISKNTSQRLRNLLVQIKSGVTPVPTTLGDYLWVTLLGGACGAAAMYGVVRVLNRFGWVKGDIILAIGQIFLHRRKNAFGLGLLLHVGTSLAFAPIYLLILSKTGFVVFPVALMVGAFLGLLHGIFVTLALVWVSSDRPMLPEFTGARLPLAVMHCAGHIAYGAVVGTTVAWVMDA